MHVYTVAHKCTPNSKLHSQFQNYTPNSKTTLRIPNLHSELKKLTPNSKSLPAPSQGTGPSFLKCTTGYYLHFKMAAANSTSPQKCEVCTATVTLYSKFCATCGAKRDEETQALKYYFNEGYEYEVILCFLLKYHGIEMSLRTLKERFKSLGLRRRTQF